jgi:hypothetical protein
MSPAVDRRPLSALTVSPSAVGGGAEKVALSLHQEYLARGIDSWLALGCRNEEVPQSLQIPNDDAHVQPTPPGCFRVHCGSSPNRLDTRAWLADMRTSTSLKASIYLNSRRALPMSCTCTPCTAPTSTSATSEQSAQRSQRCSRCTTSGCSLAIAPTRSAASIGDQGAAIVRT